MPDEIVTDLQSSLIEQRGVLLAELGTLRARALAAEARVAELARLNTIQGEMIDDLQGQRTAASERAAIVAWFRGYGGHCDECNRADTIASAADCEIHSPLDGTYEDIADAIESGDHLKRDGGEGREDGHCDECDPSFGCFSGETMCCKRSLAQRDGGEGT